MKYTSLLLSQACTSEGMPQSTARARLRKRSEIVCFGFLAVEEAAADSPTVVGTDVKGGVFSGVEILTETLLPSFGQTRSSTVATTCSPSG